ncbi:MAG TPA: phosphopentomutase [Acidobacteriota bacterium]|jgi:phosphopentomutase|nr:phosphopentomutase [Acidobacteriota bacterium]
MKFRRVILIVLDSLGIGEMPDAAAYGDVGSDTLGHIAEQRDLRIPNLQRLGMANLKSLKSVAPVPIPAGHYGRIALASPGKDTTTGHWEMAGIILQKPFPIYLRGFPQEIIERFKEETGRGVLGNIPASGTEIIARLGEEHLKTGKWIVYTSADSVFQVAAHEQKIPVEELYEACRRAREILRGDHEVGRVIARPFVGEPGNFKRTERRKDFAIDPPSVTMLDLLQDEGLPTIGIGKIASIFCYRGVSEEIKAKDNMDNCDRILQSMRKIDSGLIFSNLVDFDMVYGHRNDVQGYGRALEEFDDRLKEIEAIMTDGDLLLLTADHGCDPSTPSTDHSREYVPLIAYSKKFNGGWNLGLRRTLADIGATICENFGCRLPVGESFLSVLN